MSQPIAALPIGADGDLEHGSTVLFDNADNEHHPQDFALMYDGVMLMTHVKVLIANSTYLTPMLDPMSDVTEIPLLDYRTLVVDTQGQYGPWPQYGPPMREETVVVSRLEFVALIRCMYENSITASPQSTRIFLPRLMYMDNVPWDKVFGCLFNSQTIKVSDYPELLGGLWILETYAWY